MTRCRGGFTARDMLNSNLMAVAVPFRDVCRASRGCLSVMRHRSSQALFEHWQERRSTRLLPERCEIDPSVLRRALGDVFILSFSAAAGHPFRLAGTRLCSLAGRELKGTPFTALWEGTGAIGLAAAAADDSIGVVAGAVGTTRDGSSVELELLLLPLRHCGQTHLRMIGSLAPLTAPFWLGARPVVSLALTEHRFVGHRVVPPPLVPVLDAPPPRRRPQFVVYDGGQSRR